MGKRRYRRRSSKVQSNIEWLILGAIALYAIYKTVLESIQNFIINVRYYIQTFSALDWLYITIIITSLICLIYIFLNNQSNNRTKIKQEQAKLRVLRDSEYFKLMEMTSYDFEKFVANLYLAKGFDVELTPRTGDGGKDIILRKNNEIYLVECKRYNEKNKVSRPEIQKFHSALMDMDAKEGFFITTSYFTQPASTYSINKPIKLVDLPRLIELIEEAKGI
ncbi:restriction system protein [Cytobacillus oceanisediminis]|uniref:Restriction system protein n=1 Tax=Cytobacillus oceanisediminis TaxID=665099 RepID=A0A2V2ZQP8_9BACI|nr:restriction endonuclease [Cytobacillus oceanisediminis]PWW26636.1 restriction system protein [Cytobacillus oceanisediminis]